MKTFLVPLISILLITYGFYLVRYAYNLSKETKNSMSWPFVKGHILDVRLEEYGKAGHQNYDVGITYEYAVKSKTYKGDKVHLTTMSDKSKIEAENIIERYKKGSTVSVYYNPGNHSRAVLEPGVIKDQPHHEYASAAVVLIIAAIYTFLSSETFNELYNLLINL